MTKKDRISGIYLITNTVNGKKYIGQSEIINDREGSHFRVLRNNKSNCTKLQRAYNKYGENCFLYSILEYCEISELDEKERYWIKYYNSVLSGYNIQDGGKRGFRYSEESLKDRGIKIKEAFVRIGPENHHSIKKVYEYTTEGFFVKEWLSIKIASDNKNIPYNTLRKCLKGHLKKFKNTMWFFEYKGEQIESYKRPNTRKKIIQ